MKLSDYVMKFLVEKGVKTVFMLPGGGCMHLVDSLGRDSNLEYVTCLHEQAATIAAESYAQNTNKLGVVLVTTGPGGTNTVTGLAAAWIDSTPLLVISGQVKRSDLKGGTGVRQMGNQEVDIVPVVKTLTKYAVTVMDPLQIREILEKAYCEATSGRRGTVWVDIPLDVQAAEIDESALTPFNPPKEISTEDKSVISQIKTQIEQSKRPVILAGNGVRAAGMEKIFRDFVHKFKIPTLLTWKSIDMLDNDDEIYFGCPGNMGHRYANFILQNSDCLLILGSRLDSSLTAWNHENFAPRAKKIIIDVDSSEIEKLKMNFAIKLVADLKNVIPSMCEIEYDFDKETLENWLEYCRRMKNKYPAVTADMKNQADFVNVHAFVEELSNQLTANDVIVPESSGGAGEIVYQAVKIKYGQKIRNAAGLGSMGFGLPYALGACIANDRRRTVLINGDGAFQLNIQELATVAGQNLPIKIFILQNGGYASIQATQRNYFGGNYVGSDFNSKLFLPDIEKVACAYGLKTFQIKNNSEMKDAISNVLNSEGAVLCLVKASPFEVAMPRVQSVKLPNGSMASKPLEDMYPYLDESEIKENMLP